MAIGTPVYLGGAADATNTVSTVVITTGANAPAGAMIGVALIGGLFSVALSVTDSVGNTYLITALKNWNGVSNRIGFAYCANPAALGSGGTITVSWTTATRIAVAAVSVSGLDTVSPLDITGAGSSGTGTSDSIATGTLGQASEIIFAATGLGNTSAGYAPGGSFNILTAPTQGNTSTLLWSYQIVSATTTVTYGPAWTTSRAFGSNVYTFKAAASVGSSYGNLQLMGVG